MKQIKTIFNWFYERTALWIILFMGITFMSGLSDLNIQSSKLKKGTAECKVSCHPSSYEYIQGDQEYKCWCYQEKKILTPAKLQNWNIKCNKTNYNVY